MPSDPSPQKKTSPSKAKCPTCGAPATEDYFPFCSKRCADIDLGKWLNEEYKIESEEENDVDAYEPG